MIDSEESKKCVEKVIDNLKAKGTFDELRRECMADVDIKSSYRNLLQRVEGYVSKFLYRQKWSPTLNKNQLRNRLRNEINESEMLKNGIKHLIDQVVNEKVENRFKIKIEEALHEYLGIETEEKPENENKINENNDSNKISSEDQLEFGESISPENLDDEINDEKPPQLNNNDLTQEEQNIENEDHEVEKDDYQNKDNLTVEPMNIDDDENLDNTENVDMDIEWPSPPKPEQLTPEHIKEESLHSLQIDESSSDPNTNENKETDSKNEAEVGEASSEKPSFENLKVETKVELEDENSNLSFKSKVTIDTPKEEIQTPVKQEPKSDPEPEPAVIQQDDENADNKSEISDVSSVHTSDLSDFDDEISIEGSDSDEAPKKKISLKVVKELAASITDSKQSDSSITIENIKPQHTPTLTKEISDEDVVDQSTNTNTNKKVHEDNEGNSAKSNKRKRKINPKFMSSEYSSEMVVTETQQPTAQSQQQTKNLKRKRLPDVTESQKTETTPKITKIQTETKKQSARKTSITAEPINTNIGKNNNNNKNTKPNRNDQRYDSSDLYKPRHRLVSSRRSRSLVDPSTPESSNSNSNDDNNTDK